MHRISLASAINILNSVIDRESTPRDTRQDIARFRDCWFAFHDKNLQEIEGTLPAPLAEGETIPGVITDLVQRLQRAEQEAAGFRDTLAEAIREKDGLSNLRHETLNKINQVVQAWYSAGVTRAIESAPARIAEIARILESPAALAGD